MRMRGFNTQLLAVEFEQLPESHFAGRFEKACRLCAAGVVAVVSRGCVAVLVNASHSLDVMM